MNRAANTPERIVTRSEGAVFYCVACRKKYQKCHCKVYVSADTLKAANQGISASRRGILVDRAKERSRNRAGPSRKKREQPRKELLLKLTATRLSRVRAEGQEVSRKTVTDRDKAK